MPQVDSQRILVTGGAGFIGSALVRKLIRGSAALVINCDKFTYAAIPEALEEIVYDSKYRLIRVDICDRRGLERVFHDYRPTGVIHLAAETHVDRSIDGPLAFVRNNILGTAILLEVSYQYYRTLNPSQQATFRFHHVSTDEVFGSLSREDPAVCEDHPYAPNSPYSASKAGADHLVRAWHRTFGLPVVLTHGTNTFGPWQFPEKFIPTMIISAIRGSPLPIYGRGENVRDWLFVEDHVDALWQVFNTGTIGEAYNIGGRNEYPNRQIASQICGLLDEIMPESVYRPHEQLITFVPDRPGHDFRYAIDTAKIKQQMNWQPRHDFHAALELCVRWYVRNRPWWERILSTRYEGIRLGRVRSAPETVA